MSTKVQKLLVKRNREFYRRYADESDEFGFDLNVLTVCEPFLRFLFEEYFSVQTIGIENVPSRGRVVLVGNHSGGIPIDALMTFCALYYNHPCPRRIRVLSLPDIYNLPRLRKIIRGLGAVPASFNVARKLLEQDELVLFYPEGPRGTGKAFSMRYRLNDFDPGFVKAALATDAPIIPITVIGADEFYPLLSDVRSIARLLHFPYYPITTSFPWLPFPVSSIPLPIRLLIKFGAPIHLDREHAAITDRKYRLMIAREIQYDIQRELNSLLRQRTSPHAGWSLDSLDLPQESYPHHFQTAN